MSQASAIVASGGVPDHRAETRMNNITINCDDCIMRATTTCADCVVTFLCDRRDDSAVVFDLAEQRVVRWFADAGLVPTLRHRAEATA